MRLTSVLIFLLALATPARSATLPTDFAEDTFASGLSFPISLRFLPDGRVLVAQQGGAIRLVDGGGAGPHDQVLVVPNVNTIGQERGLLAVEIDPGWPARNFIYAYYTHDNGQRDVRVTRYTASGDLDGTGDGSLSFSTSSALHVLTGIPNNASNHNGGDLRFGLDGLLYISTGDDEGARCLAQDPTSLVGKLLRIKVDHLSAAATGTLTLSDVDPGSTPFPGQGAVAALVYTRGLRNPFRFRVDALTGDFFVADVGKNKWEELSHVDDAGLNLGWPYREGYVSTAGDNAVDISACPVIPPDFDPFDPIAVYPNTNAAARSIMVGPVYRGTGADAWPADYVGDVFYVDYYLGDLFRLTGSGQSWSVEPAPGEPAGGNWATGVNSAADFAVGPAGSVYVLNQIGGVILRFTYTGSTTAEPRSVGSIKSLFDQREEP